jgi:acetyl-CoA C-acetyltransferase
VGVAAVTGTGDAEAIELMAQAVESAVADAGGGRLLDRIGWIGVPEGSWGYADPARLLASRFGIDGAHTVRADVGRTQQELIARACTAVADDGSEVALVVGGEAKARAARAARAGEPAAETVQPDGVEPDEVMAPGSLGLHDVELVHNTVVPATAYALIENAVAAANDGRSDDDSGHRERLGALYERFAAVAAANPHAWDRHAWTGAEIVTPSAENRVLASPYTKRLCSQWNVDQAAALLVVSADAARSLGVATDRWVFPWSSAVANRAVPVPARAALHRSLGAEAAGQRALELAGVTIDDIDVVDLYSCFPAAVQIHAAAVGLSLDPLPDAQRLTHTGGMSFAGGPLNNYVLQAMVRVVTALRDEPESVGLSTSVSTYLTKHGFGVWSASPPRSGRFVHEVVEVGDEALDVVAELDGPVRVVSSTVVHEHEEPARAVAVVESTGGGSSSGGSRDGGSRDGGSRDGGSGGGGSRDPRVRTIVESREPAALAAFGASTLVGALVSADLHM